MDAGYDAKKLQNKILSYQWDLLMAIGCQRSIWIIREKPSHCGQKQVKLGVGVIDALRRLNRRAEKITCKLPKLQVQKKEENIDREEMTRLPQRSEKPDTGHSLISNQTARKD